MPRKAIVESVPAEEIFRPKLVAAVVEAPKSPAIHAKIAMDDNGNISITFPQTVTLDQLRRRKDGHPFVQVLADQVELLVVQDVPGGDRKERVMFTYPVEFRLSMKVQ